MPFRYAEAEVIDMTLGENLQRLRKEKELSQEDVARALFVSRQTISNGRQTRQSREWIT